jgi:hypothetical protein
MRFVIAAVLIVLAAGVRPVRADERRDAAGIHFSAAQAAERRHDWKTAIEEYENAYKLAPHPSVLFNMANAHEHLRHYREAGELFERYLHDAPDADDRQQVEKRIEKLRQHSSKVTVSYPPGATLVIDGEHRGRIPTSLELPAGTYHVHAERGPSTSQIQIVNLAYGDPAELAFEIVDQPPVSPTGRPLPTLSFGVGLAAHTGIGNEWDKTFPVSYGGRLGGTYPLTGKLRLFVELEGAIGPKAEDHSLHLLSRSSDVTGPSERYLMLSPRAGAQLEVWQRGFASLVAFGAAASTFGYHSLAFGFGGSRVVARQSVHGFGFGGGLALYGRNIKTPRAQWYASIAWYYVPADVGTDTGFRSQGTVDVGGFEFTFGYAFALGTIASRPPTQIARVP